MRLAIAVASRQSSWSNYSTIKWMLLTIFSHALVCTSREQIYLISNPSIYCTASKISSPRWSSPIISAARTYCRSCFRLSSMCGCQSRTSCSCCSYISRCMHPGLFAASSEIYSVRWITVSDFESSSRTVMRPRSSSAVLRGCSGSNSTSSFAASSSAPVSSASSPGCYSAGCSSALDCSCCTGNELSRCRSVVSAKRSSRCCCGSCK